MSWHGSLKNGKHSLEPKVRKPVLKEAAHLNPNVCVYSVLIFNESLSHKLVARL